MQRSARHICRYRWRRLSHSTQHACRKMWQHERGGGRGCFCSQKLWPQVWLLQEEVEDTQGDTATYIEDPAFISMTQQMRPSRWRRSLVDVFVFGWAESRWTLLKYRYEGYEQPEWQPEQLLRRDGCHAAIRDFWCKSGLTPDKEFYVDNDNFRCCVCARLYKRWQDIKVHQTKTKNYNMTK